MKPGPRVLVAGIGNMFLGDDGFGVEVVRRLLARPQPDGVRVTDFGIRGLDLAYALESCRAAIFVDASPRGGPPGTLYVIEPATSGLAAPTGPSPGRQPPVSVGTARVSKRTGAARVSKRGRWQSPQRLVPLLTRGAPVRLLTRAVPTAWSLSEVDAYAGPSPAPVLDPHAMTLDRVLARLPPEAMPRTLRVVACEPSTFEPDGDDLGLSPAVAAAVEPAVLLVESLLAQLLAETSPRA